MEKETEQPSLGLQIPQEPPTHVGAAGGESGRCGLGKARNRLNDLDVRAWMRGTKSWFVCNPPPRSAAQLRHPAKFPEELVREGRRTLVALGVFAVFVGVERLVRVRAARRDARDRRRWRTGWRM